MLILKKEIRDVLEINVLMGYTLFLWSPAGQMGIMRGDSWKVGGIHLCWKSMAGVFSEKISVDINFPFICIFK